MIWGLIQFFDLVENSRIHMFLVFFIVVWVLFLFKIWKASKYKHYTNEYSTTVSVIVPVYNENNTEFIKCLNSIIKNKPDELLVVLDERELGRYESLLNDLSINYTYSLPGKREAIVKGVNNTSGNIVLIVDSDTLLSSDTIKEMVRPFVDENVGGVTCEQRILNWDSSLTRRLMDWMEDFRWTISNKAMSSDGVVGCLPGRAMAFSRSAIVRSMGPFLDKFLNDSFMGKRCITGDDRHLTSLILQSGYKAVFQDTTKVYTTVPNNWKQFLKMHLRWARSNQRETIKALLWYVKKPPILALSFLADIIIPFLLFAVIAEGIINILWHINPVLITQGSLYDKFGLSILIGLCGMLLSLGLRQISHLKNRRQDIKYLPVWVFFVTFIMIPIRLAGFFTMWKQGWMTR